jgi:hypothetical protein
MRRSLSTLLVVIALVWSLLSAVAMVPLWPAVMLVAIGQLVREGTILVRM